MASIVLAAALVAPLSMREMPRPSPAKAKLTNRENRPRVGAAFARALGIVGWSIKEAAAALDVEPAQVSRWIPRVFTVAAVATRLGCATSTVYALLTSGRLDGFKVGSAWRVTETALLAFMHHAAVAPEIAAPAFEPPADPLAFDRLIPSTRVFSGPRAS